jgi:hypothetical protein
MYHFGFYPGPQQGHPLMETHPYARQQTPETMKFGIDPFYQQQYDLNYFDPYSQPASSSENTFDVEEEIEPARQPALERRIAALERKNQEQTQELNRQNQEIRRQNQEAARLNREINRLNQEVNRLNQNDVRTTRRLNRLNQRLRTVENRLNIPFTAEDGF